MAKNNETTVTFKVFNKEYRNGISEMEKDGVKFRQELKLEQEQLKQTGSQTEKMTSVLTSLEKQYEVAKNKTQASTEALEKAKSLFGENSQAVAEMEKSLRSHQIAEQQVANKIAKTTEELEKAKSAESSRAKELSSLKSSQDDLSSSSEKLTKQYELQKAELGNNAKESDKARLNQKYLADQMDNSADQVKNLEQQLALSKKQFGENSKEVDQLEKELLDAKVASQQFTNEFKDATNKLKNFGDKAQEVGGKIKDIGKKWTMGVSLPIVAGVTASVKAAADFETAFAGVKKTVDEAVDSNGKVIISYDDLEQGIRSMAKELPASAAQISEVAESAGQLGIKTENVLSFTRTMIDMGESTNLASEEAASSLAQLANITQMPQENFDRLGSSIVALGNNMATTESNIVEMSLRLAGSAKQANMTEDQIMGMAAAMSSVGINAESGGSSMSRFVQKVQTAVLSGSKELDVFAKTAGMSSEEFQKAWKDDAASAVVEFVKGLGKVKDAGGDVTSVLKEMGLNSTQEIDTMLRLSGAGETLSEALDISAEGWKGNSALTEEANKRYETLDSKIATVKNTLVDLGIEFGGPFMDALLDVLEGLKPVFDILSRLAESFSNASPQTQKFIMAILGILVAVGPLLTIIGSLISIIGVVASAFSIGAAAAAGIVMVIPIIIVAIAALVAAIVIYWDDIVEFTNKLWKDIVKIFNDLWSDIKGVFSGIGNFFSDVWEEISTSTVSKVTEMKDSVTNKVDEIKKGVTDKWKEIKGAIEKVIDDIKTSIGNKWDDIRQGAIDIWESVVEKVSPIIDYLYRVIMVPISLLQTALDAVWTLIVAGATIAWEFIKQSAITVWGAIKDHILTPIVNVYDSIVIILSEMGTWIVNKWNELVLWTKELWDGFKQAIITPVIETYERIKEYIGNILTYVSEKFSELKTTVGQIWTDIKMSIVGTFNETKDKVTATASNIWTSLTDNFSKILANVKKTFGKIKDAIVGPIIEAKEGIEKAIDSIVGFFANIKFPKFSLKKSSKKILGKEIEYPSGIDVSWNALGGIFSSPTIIGSYGGKLQGVGEAGREAVIPLNAKTLSQIGREIFNALSIKEITQPLLNGLVVAAQSKMVQTNQPEQTLSDNNIVLLLAKLIEVVEKKEFKAELPSSGPISPKGFNKYDGLNAGMNRAAKDFNLGLR